MVSYKIDAISLTFFDFTPIKSVYIRNISLSNNDLMLKSVYLKYTLPGKPILKLTIPFWI